MAAPPFRAKGRNEGSYGGDPSILADHDHGGRVGDLMGALEPSGLSFAIRVDSEVESIDFNDVVAVT